MHPTQIGTWKRAAIENMATAFTRKGSALEPVSTVDIDKLHSKIGQLVVERDFLADASHQLLGTRPSRDLAETIRASGRVRRANRPDTRLLLTSAQISFKYVLLCSGYPHRTFAAPCLNW